MSGTTAKGVRTGRRSTPLPYYEALLLDPALNRLNLMSSVQTHHAEGEFNVLKAELLGVPVYGNLFGKPQVKLEASFGLPVPLYMAADGYAQTRRLPTSFPF
jgi:hypothetical protein